MTLFGSHKPVFLFLLVPLGHLLTFSRDSATAGSAIADSATATSATATSASGSRIINLFFNFLLLFLFVTSIIYILPI